MTHDLQDPLGAAQDDRRFLGAPFRMLRSCVLCAALIASGVGCASAQDAENPAEKRMMEAAGEMSASPRMAELAHDKRKQLVEFVAGNVAFVLTHELGHAIVSDLGIPVLGRLEDAADSYAIIAMLDMDTDMSVRTLIEATMGWFLSSRRESAEGNMVRYFDAHGLSNQRAYQIVCLMVGSDAKRFDELAERTKMPASRRQSCVADFSNASWSWNQVLKPHLRDEGSPQTTISVKYSPTTEDMSMYVRALKATHLLETMATKASHKYKWRAPFVIEARSCGHPNAFWHLPSRTLVLCYELAADFAQLYRKYGVVDATGGLQQ